MENIIITEVGVFNVSIDTVGITEIGGNGAYKKGNTNPTPTEQWFQFDVTPLDSDYQLIS